MICIKYEVLYYIILLYYKLYISYLSAPDTCSWQNPTDVFAQNKHTHKCVSRLINGFDPLATQR